MTRGSLAPLQPPRGNDAPARRAGVSKAATLSKLDVKRLKALALIEENDGESPGLRVSDGSATSPFQKPRRRPVPLIGGITISRLGKFMNEARG